MTYQYLKVENKSNISIVTLSRTERRNALNYDFLEEIEHCALSFREQAEVYAVVFRGEGVHFSAGADLTEMDNYPEMSMVQKRRRWRIGERAIRAIRQIDQITFAAWNGGALGGGACLVSALDFRVGDKNCFLQYPEIDIGLNLMWQSVPHTVNLYGQTNAKRLLIGGERIESQELLNWGAIEKVAESDKLLQETLELAKKYATKSPIAAQMIKRSINQTSDALDQAFMHMDADQNLFTFTTTDQKEAMTNYRAGKAAHFKGD